MLEITSYCFSISLLCKRAITYAVCNLHPELRSWYFDKCKFSPGSCFELNTQRSCNVTRKSRSAVSVYKLLKKGCSLALIGISNAGYDYQGSFSLNNGSTVTVRLVLFISLVISDLPCGKKKMAL